MTKNIMETEYKRLRELGEWLNRFFDSKLSPFDIEGLADDGLQLLDINYVRDKRDPVVATLISLLETFDAEKLSTVHDLDHELREAFTRHSIRALNLMKCFLPPVTKDPNLQPFRSQLLKVAYPEHKEEEDKKLLINEKLRIHARETIKGTAESTFYLRGLIKIIVSTLTKEPSKPWEYVLSLPENLKGKQIADPLELLILHYNSIREWLRESERKVVFVTLMENQRRNKDLQYVDFPALLSRIFINFLRLGGREYCGICPQCGDFFIAERKGRRKFCHKGACRAADNRARRKKN